MSDNKNKSEKEFLSIERKKVYGGYQPTKGHLDSSNPPQGGSGLPSKSTSTKSKTDKKD